MKNNRKLFCGDRHQLDLLAMRLRRYNEWRRGADFEQPQPAVIGRDIDAAISIIEQHIALIDEKSQA